MVGETIEATLIAPEGELRGCVFRLADMGDGVISVVGEESAREIRESRAEPPILDCVELSVPSSVKLEAHRGIEAAHAYSKDPWKNSRRNRGRRAY